MLWLHAKAADNISYLSYILSRPRTLFCELRLLDLRLSGKLRSTVTCLLIRTQDRPISITKSTSIIYTKLPIFSSRKISKSSIMLGAKERDLYRFNRYRPRIDVSSNTTIAPVFTSVNLSPKASASVYYSAIVLVRYSITSSKYIVPAPPGTETLPLVPRPIASL
jgi:hypothetical protein